MRVVVGVAFAGILSLVAGCAVEGGSERRQLAVSLGPDRTAETGDLVEISATVENSQGPVSYAWSFLSLPPDSLAVLFDAQTASASFAADVEGEYVVQLDVRDDDYVVSTMVGVSVLQKPHVNGPPVAVASGAATGPVNGQFANNASAALLDGTSSTDPDGDPLFYQWGFVGKPLGSLAILNDPTLARPSLLIDRAGEYELVLQVSDGAEWSAPATWTLVAAGASHVALAAGDAQSERVGSPLPEALTVEVTNEFGDAIEGIAVRFDVAAGAGGDGFASGIDHTEANGLASDAWTLGTITGPRSATATAIRYIDNVGNAALFPPIVFNATGRSGLAVDFTLEVPAHASVDDGMSVTATGYDVHGNAALDDHETAITLRASGASRLGPVASVGTVLAGGNTGSASVRVAGGEVSIPLNDTRAETVVVWIGDQTYSGSVGPFAPPPVYGGAPADLVSFSFSGVPLATEGGTLVLTGRGDFGGGRSLTVADGEVFEFFVEAFGSAPNCSPSAVTEHFPIPFENVLGLSLDGSIDLVAANLSGFDPGICDQNEIAAGLSFGGSALGTTTVFRAGATSQIVLRDPRDVQAGNSMLLEAHAADRYGNFVGEDDASRFRLTLSGTNASFAITAAQGTVVAGSGNAVTLRVRDGLASIDAFNGAREEVTFQLEDPIPSTLDVSGSRNGRFTGPPDRVTIVSGNAQSGTVGQPLGEPIVLEVHDDTGHTVPDAMVSFSTVLNSGVFSALDPISDRDGRVFASFVLGAAAGANEGSATVWGSLDAAVSATGVVAAPSTVRLLAVPPLAPGSDVATVVLEVHDAYGNVVGSDDSTTFSVEAGGSASWTAVGTGVGLDGLGSQVIQVRVASGVAVLELTDLVDGDVASVVHFDSLENGLAYTTDGGSVSVTFPPF